MPQIIPVSPHPPNSGLESGKYLYILTWHDIPAHEHTSVVLLVQRQLVVLRPLHELFLLRGCFRCAGVCRRASSGLLRTLLLEYEGGHSDNNNSIDICRFEMWCICFVFCLMLAPLYNLLQTTYRGKGILHLHCHDKASGLPTDRQWMEQCFDQIDEPEAGCCGMAGTFGMRQKTRHLGQVLFARHLKPAFESASDDTIIVTNGFSCHEQFNDNTQKQVLHPIQVIEKCL